MQRIFNELEIYSVKFKDINKNLDMDFIGKERPLKDQIFWGKFPDGKMSLLIYQNEDNQDVIRSISFDDSFYGFVTEELKELKRLYNNIKKVEK